jgi:hypothetical protein
MHYIRIGKLGHIARMLNPKNRNGPVACTTYPTKPGESCRKAITAQERIEASILTHTTWMSDPPERKTVTLLIYEVGPNGITINTQKEFDDEAQWKYLEEMLKSKVEKRIAERISLAHHKLPELFKQIKTDTKITYPFKYGCMSREYMYPELGNQLEKEHCTR